jgi:hypothetical protein
MRSNWRLICGGLLVLSLMPVWGAAQAQRDAETENFVRGFVRFLAYHEAGHMLMGQIAELNSNTDWSNADREDYADRFAMILLEPDAGDPDGVDEIISAAGGWLQVDSSILRDEPHAPAESRALEIICLLYGSNPEQFAMMADATPPDRDCAADYQALENDVEEVFRDKSGEFGREIEVVYGPPINGMNDARQFLEFSGIMEDLKLDIELDFYLTHRTTIQAMSCEGKAKSDTFYSDRVRGASPEDDHFVITLCYEMIDARLKYGMRGFE